jgi:hypothetical protein
MGIYDRDYTRENYGQYHGRPQMGMRFPRLTPVVKKLLIANIAIFFISIIFFPRNVDVGLGQPITLLEK